MTLRPRLFALALICASSSRLAAQDAPIPAAAVKPAAAAVAPAPAKNAAEAWSNLEKTRDAVEQAQSRDEAVAAVKKTLAEAEAFLKQYPSDSKRWDAKILGMDLRLKAAGLLETKPEDAIPDAKELAAILDAPDAGAGAKSDAAFLALMGKAVGVVDPRKPETLPPFTKAMTEFLDKYGDSAHAPEVAEMQIQLMTGTNSPDLDETLKHLAASANPKVSDQAKETVTQRDRLADLKKKPVDIKFTATNGSEIDLAKLRGKVVLVDFWASWCGPCMAEAPNVVKTYAKLHPKGFEIVGISLDEDKAAMEGAVKKQGMPWAQYFDGAGWQNKISSSFGIQSIPTAWLLDKKGLLRETSLRGDDLGAGVEKLLGE